MRYEEEGDVVAISSMNVYSSCTRQPCYNKKLSDNKCPKCNTQYDGKNDHKSVVCTVAVEQNEDIKEITLFSPQVKELLQQKEVKIETIDCLEESILQNLPIKVGFTKSPNKDSNTVSAFKVIP